MAKISKIKLLNFLTELTELSKKHNLYLDTTDDMFITDFDKLEDVSLKFSHEEDKYIF